MRSGSSLPAVLAALIAASAHAQGTTATTTGTTGGADSKDEGGSCFSCGPTFGTTVVDIGWNTSPTQLGVLPGVRVGYRLEKGFVAADLGLSLWTSPSIGYGQFALKLGGVYAYDFGKAGPLDIYGLGGLDANFLATISSGGGSFGPLYGFTLGVGLEYALDKRWTLGAEAGLHTLLDFGPSDIGASTGLFVSVTGSWSLPGECPYSGTGTGKPPPDGPMTPPPDEPHTTPPPEVVTHHDSYATPCSVFVNDGWMEPTQAVWQDDLSFDDKAGKQLTRLEGDTVAYWAEMPMVTRKDTLLFGVHHYQRAGAPVQVDSRDFIVLSGLTNCTTPRPVKMRFTLSGAGPPKTLWTSEEIGQVKLTGPAQKEYEPWSVRLPVRDGVPPSNTFTIDGAGIYQVRAELLDAGNPTGLLMTVGGDAKVMTGPAVHFVPIILTAKDAAAEESLHLLTEGMEKDARLMIPDVFPLAPGGLPTDVRVLRNLSDAKVPERWFEARRISYLVAALNDTLAASTFLDGAGRVVAVMSGADFKSVFGTGSAGMTVAESVEVRARGSTARTLSWKVMMVPSFERWDTVAHEILHTLPEGWADDEMKAECGRAYHNKEDPLAHGERITLDSAPTTRERKVAMISLMGPWVSESKIWMDQCTYWHLTKMLAGAPPDPPVMMVRAMVGTKKNGKPMGELRPIYELMGNADLTASTNPKSGPYAFVFKDAKGAALARFPFNPRATDIETKGKLEVMSFVGRVPVVPGWAQLELQAANGTVLDKKVRSETPPQVAIEEPNDGAQVTPQVPPDAAGKKKVGKVKVRWTAKPAADELTVLSSVLYSSNKGASWTDQAFEQPIEELDVALNPNATEHLIKVVTTDGTRSAEAIIRVYTGPPPTPAPKPGGPGK